MLIVALVYSCSADVGGSEDRTPPVVTLLSPDQNEEVIGVYTIRWQTEEDNPSKVNIYLSHDSGNSWTMLKQGEPDTGESEWDSNEVADCRTCRIRIEAIDVTGNTSAFAESSEDFIINNVPEVLGEAYYSDSNGDNIRAGDTIRVPFDKPLVLKTSIASDIFEIPVIGDEIGSFAEVEINPTNNRELVITLNDFGSAGFHLHLPGQFSPEKLYQTAPSGLNLRSNISEGVLAAIDTGRTANRSVEGIDIAPALATDGTVFGSGLSIKDFELGDVDNDGDIDIVSVNFDGCRVWLNDGKGAFTDSNQAALLGASIDTVKLADLDNDGDLDLVMNDGPAPNDGAQVWLNDGTGVYGTQTALGGVNASAITVLDVEGDGDMDIILAVSGSEAAIWLNDGAGNFLDSGRTIASTSILDFLALDVDNDLDVDVVTATDQGVRVWLNGGDSSGSQTGVFADSGQLLDTVPAVCSIFCIQRLIAGDVDNDGDDDIVVSVALGGASLWLNEGVATGVFTKSRQALNSVIGYGARYELTDIDDDGDLDLIAAGISGVSMWLNGGGAKGESSGEFVDVGHRLQGVRIENLAKIAAADVDGDEDQDVVIADIEFSLWKNSLRRGDDFFVESRVALPGLASVDAVLKDIDDDGDLDLFAAGFGGVRIWENLSSEAETNRGVFIDSVQTIGDDAVTVSIAMGDVDGDGDIDLIAGNSFLGVPEDKLWLNGGDASGSNTGVFVDSGQTFGTFDTSDVELADVDGDGDLDAITVNSDAIRLWPNGDDSGNNTGVFSDTPQELAGTNVGSIAVGDVDGDGDLDIVGRKIWLNDGAGVFTDSGQTVVASTAVEFALGDVDGDGDLDIVEGEGTSLNDNRILLNNGAGLFSPSSQTLGSDRVSAIALVDIDEDGDLDIILGNANEVEDTVWINGGDSSGSNTGVFRQAGQVFDSTSTFALAVGDIDGDGDVDFIATDAKGNDRIWLNDL